MSLKTLSMRPSTMKSTVLRARMPARPTAKKHRLTRHRPPISSARTTTTQTTLTLTLTNQTPIQQNQKQN
jgi:hypothetical protein